VGWLVYDGLCRSPLGLRPGALAALGLFLVTALAWALQQALSPRAAYLHVGAVLGTCMAWNVFFHIIPGQRAMVEATRRGERPDPERGRAGAMRSLHNNYLTLPVLFVMVSAHFPMTYGHPWGFALLAALFTLSGLLKHYLNLLDRGARASWIPAVLVLGVVGAAFAVRPEVPEGEPVRFKDAETVVRARCTPCHSERPTQPGFAQAPAGIVLDTSPQMVALAGRIRAVAVDAQQMPLGNLTGMTVEERARLGLWIAQGARLE
jgi:uncharacterized membrane protein